MDSQILTLDILTNFLEVEMSLVHSINFYLFTELKSYDM